MGRAHKPPTREIDNFKARAQATAGLTDLVRRRAGEGHRRVSARSGSPPQSTPGSSRHQPVKIKLESVSSLSSIPTRRKFSQQRYSALGRRS